MALRAWARRAGGRGGRFPPDPWGRWAFALMLASAVAVVSSFFFPWWGLRDESGSVISLWNGQWCGTAPNQAPRCFRYAGPTAGLFPASLLSNLLVLEVLQVVAAIAFVLAFVLYALPRARARAPRAPALVMMVGTLSSASAFVFAWFAIPGSEAVPFLAPASGFTGATVGPFFGYAWGAENAWFLLFLSAGTGILAFLAMRAAARSSN